MIKALCLIFEPVEAWDRVIAARRGVLSLFLIHVLPTVLIVAALEGCGLMKWGRHQWNSGQVRFFTAGEMAVYETLQSLALIGTVFVCALIVKAFCNASYMRHTFSQGFTVAACALSPMFLLRMLDAFPMINPWVTWGVGIMLCAGTLYHGIPRVMQPDPSQGFGLFIMSSILFIMVTGLERFVTEWLLAGRIPKISEFITHVANHLPF